MGAFNNRIQVKEIIGIPAWSVFGLLGALVAAVLTVLMALTFKFWLGAIVTGAATIAALVFAGAVLYLGDDGPLFPVMRENFRDRRRGVTSETWSEQ